jgi:hypothetical protein
MWVLHGTPVKAVLRAGCVLAMSAVVLAVAGTSPAWSQANASAGSAAASATSLEGLWWGIAVGGAGTRLTCDLCDPSRDLGPTVQFSIGSYATPTLRIGLEAGGWTHEDDESREKVYRAGVIANLRPSLERGLYLIGGFGWSSYRAGNFRYNAPSLSLGAGWDYPLGEDWRVGNQMTLDASSYGSLKNEERSVARNVGMSLVRFSVHLHRL